jgi:hypothetical protein
MRIAGNRRKPFGAVSIEKKYLSWIMKSIPPNPAPHPAWLGIGKK